MTHDFSDKTVLVTGAAGGIGRECARIFADAGASVILADLDRDAVDAVAEEIGDAARTTVVAGDLTADETLERIRDAVEAAGGIHALVPAAGIYPEQDVQDMSRDEWRRTMSVNLDAVFALTQTVLPHLHRDGAIVNFSSLAGSRGSRNHAHYAATKAALVAFGRSLALEVGDRGIRVNAVAPGIIETHMTDALRSTSGEDLRRQTPLGRHGTAREVATVVAFLCSDAASFVNGELIQVNGGLYMAG